jgi:hypothetical protein
MEVRCFHGTYCTAEERHVAQDRQKNETGEQDPNYIRIKANRAYLL